jgi:redox-sensitive bicupin YhaK (pirin superfamily)
VSNVEAEPREATAGGRESVAGQPVHQMLAGREVVLGGPRGLPVSRTLPHRDRRMVGAWCFLDRYGPHDTSDGAGMRVPPHPHTGLQTVSWLLDGEILHLDSLGSRQLIRPGQLNLMTAGRAIAHSEESPGVRSPLLSGVQLWVALPDAHRATAPAFEHHARLPVHQTDGLTATVVLGALAGAASPARTFSPLLGADIEVTAVGGRLPLRAGFEHAVLVLTGRAVVDGVELGPGPLLYLGSGRTELAIAAVEPARVLLLGGEPFEERIVMWWNFVGRSHEEIVQSRADWMAGRLGEVAGFDGDPLPAPVLPATQLLPRGRER